MKEATLRKISEDFRSFYERLGIAKVKPSRGQGTGICCLHDDHSPSFSFNLATGFFHCFGCGASGDIFTFYALKHDLDVRQDFPAVLQGIAQEFGIPITSKPTNSKSASSSKSANSLESRIVKTYDYTDESGTLLYQICRLEPKDFRVRRPDGKGGWIWNFGDVPLVLYNLPQVIKADEVIVCEGEKDADRLNALGYTATTNPFGAGKWKPEYSEPLKGKKVVIPPDNDDAGRKHVEAVAKDTYGKATSLKILTLPDLPEKGDMSDFLSTFNDPEVATERIAILIDSAQEWQPEQVTPTEPVTKKPLDLTFPNIMRGIAGAYAEAYSAISEAPKHFYFMAFLTCLGNAVADVVRLQSLLNVQPRLYTIFLGLSGRGKKSTPIDITTNFFKEAFDVYGLMHYANSGEGLGVFLEKSPVTLLVYDEFMGFVSKAIQKGNTLLGTVTSLFEKNQYQTATKDKQLMIEGAFLSMLAACTEDTWQRCWHTDFTAIGLINRLFLVPGGMEKKVSIPPPLDMKLRVELENDLRNIVKLARRIREYRLTESAAARYDHWYNNELDHKSIHSVRLDAYALRFMLLLTISRALTEITEEIVEDTLKLVNWQYQVRRLLDPIDADNEMAKVEARIRRELLKGPRNIRDLQRNTHAYRVGVWLWKTALSNLRDNDEIAYDAHNKTYFLEGED